MASPHQNLIAIRRLRLELATLAGQNLGMFMRRTLFLCFLTLTLAVTGPFARGLSAQAAQLLQPVNLTWSGAVTNPKTATHPSKRCQRGAVAWSSCALDLGHVPERLDIGMEGSGRVFDRVLDGTAGGLWRSRLFRPPRTG